MMNHESQVNFDSLVSFFTLIFSIEIPVDTISIIITALNVETLLKCDLPTPIKSTIPLSSPTFPIPGSSDPSPPQSSITAHSEPQYNPEYLPQCEPIKQVETCLKTEKPQPSSAQKVPTGDSVMYYTPDEEELEISNSGGPEKVESASYVPPFNNPLYPNSTYTNYGSVIGEFNYFLFKKFKTLRSHSFFYSR